MLNLSPTEYGPLLDEMFETDSRDLVLPIFIYLKMLEQEPTMTQVRNTLHASAEEKSAIVALIALRETSWASLCDFEQKRVNGNTSLITEAVGDGIPDALFIQLTHQVDLINKAIAACAVSPTPHIAFQLMDLLVRSGVRPTAESFEPLFGVPVASNPLPGDRKQQAMHLMERMRKLNVIPTREVYHRFLECHSTGRKQDFLDALEILQDMDQQRLAPDQDTFQKLLAAAYSTRDRSFVSLVLRKAENYGVTFEQEVVRATARMIDPDSRTA